MSSTSQHPSSRELHERHADERSRVHALERHERQIRDRERERVLVHMLPAEQCYDDTGFLEGGLL